MADILFSFTIDAPHERVFEAIATPGGLNQWWPLAATGVPEHGAAYEFDFGGDGRFHAVVSRCDAGRELEWTMMRCDPDWDGTKVAFTLAPEASGTRVEFAHTGWKTANRHCRVSAFCWAAYLRLLKRQVERGDVVPFRERKALV